MGNQEEPYSQLSSLKFSEPVEHFCPITYKDRLVYLVANGPLISIVEVKDEAMTLLTTFHAFQKPVLKVCWDSNKERILASGLDQQIKFFELIEENEEIQMRLTYKMKLPNAVFQLSVSSDGNHYVVGLLNGSLIIKSK